MPSVDYIRRHLVRSGVAGAGLVLFAPLITHAAAITPRQSEGPFYPTRLPLDKDNDLVSVAGRSELAQGEIVDVVGRVVNERGRPIANARIEIWQCNQFGRYHHPRDQRNAPLDPNFQGYGQFVTKTDGAYRFRTIKPVPYPGRAPHIHFAISGAGFEKLITQMYVAGAPENQRDYLLNRIADEKLRRSLIVDFQKSAAATPVGQFDIVLATDGRYG